MEQKNDIQGISTCKSDLHNKAAVRQLLAGEKRQQKKDYKNGPNKASNAERDIRELEKTQQEYSNYTDKSKPLKSSFKAGGHEKIKMDKSREQLDYEDTSICLESHPRSKIMTIKLDAIKHEPSENNAKKEDESEYISEAVQVEQELAGYEEKSNFMQADEEKELKDEYSREIEHIEQEQTSYENITASLPASPKKDNIEKYSRELESVEQELAEYQDRSENSVEADHNAGKIAPVFEETSRYAKDKRAILNDVNDKVPYEYALRILSRYDLRYLDSPKTSKIYIFNGKIWEPLRDADDMASIVYKEMSVEDKRLQENIEGFCRKVASFIKFECRERNESGKARFLESDFKAVENRIVFKNCVYDIRTGESIPHDKHLSYYIGIDSDYIEEDVETPMYEKLKIDATGGDKESMDMFDLMLGYLMIPNRSGKCYFVMADAKDSGKSIFGHFIESIYMGDRVKTIDLEHLSGRFSMTDVDCVTLLSGLEASMDRLTLPVAAQIKRITGESRIRAEAKYKGEQDVPIRFKLILATNGAMLLPRNMSDNAFYRRTIIIPFIKSKPLNQIIADMPKHLQAEKSAIVSKAARRIGSIVEHDGGIHFPESGLSLRIKETWMGSADYEGVFIREKLKFTAREEDAILKEDIYRQYQSCFEKMTGNNTNAAMLTKNELMQRIMERYPGVSAKKLRRGSMECVGEIKLRPCMTCLAWNELIV